MATAEPNPDLNVGPLRLVIAVFWFLKQEGVQRAETIARQAERSFNEFPHWQTNSIRNRNYGDLSIRQ